jgi:hypothetical protein
LLKDPLRKALDDWDFLVFHGTLHQSLAPIQDKVRYIFLIIETGGLESIQEVLPVHSSDCLTIHLKLFVRLLHERDVVTRSYTAFMSNRCTVVPEAIFESFCLYFCIMRVIHNMNDVIRKQYDFQWLSPSIP